MASMTVAVTLVIEDPSAGIVALGENWTADTDAAGPCWISVACVDTPVSEASDAVIVTGPGVVELVIVADHVPVPESKAGVPTLSPESLELSETLSVELALGSVIVIVAVVCEAPSAAIMLGESCRLMFEPSAQAGAASQ